MVITFVIDEYGMDTNGTTNFLRRYSTKLMSLGHEVRILCGKGEGKEVLFKTGEARYPFKKLINSEGMSFAKYDKEIAKKAIEGSDIVHFIHPFRLERKVKSLCDKLHIPTSADFHMLPENISEAVHLNHFKLINNYLYRKFRRFYNKFNIIHCPSELIKDLLIRKKFKSEIISISNGVSNFFSKSASKLEQENRDKFIIVMSGRFSNEKKQELLINAIKNSKYESKIQLILAGRGPLEDKYKKLGSVLTNKPILNFYTQEELRFILSNATLYVHTSDVETEGLACLEAMSCGCPVIISDSPNSASSQYAISCYSLFTRNDYMNLSQKIDYLLDNKDKRLELAFLYQTMSKNYSLDVSVDRFINEILIQSIEKNKTKL